MPAIDIRRGRCVRLLRGDYASETVYGDSPQQLAVSLRQSGFTSLHVVDLDGARSGRQHCSAIVGEMTNVPGLSIQLGGGIRDAASLRDWLDCGVTRCVLGSVAVENPQLVRSWTEEFGAGRIVLALDVRISSDGAALLATHGWARSPGVSLWQYLDDHVGARPCTVLCTDIGRDGAMTGPNLELYRQILHRYPRLSLQASGGVRNAGDLTALRDLGVHAAITGRALLDGAISKQEIESLLRVA